MSKVSINTNTEVTPEEIAQAEQLFSIKSESGEFIDVVDNLDDAKAIADKNPGAAVYNDETDELVYPVPVVEEVKEAEPVVEETPVEPAVEEVPVVEEAVEEPVKEAFETPELIPVADVVDQVIEEELAPVKKEEKKVEPKQTKPSKACVQVVAVNDVIKTVEPEVKETKATAVIMPGKIVKLVKAHLYKSAYVPQPFKLMTGSVFIFDAQCINGRYRVTNNVNNCGGDIKNVIGYISAECVK